MELPERASRVLRAVVAEFIRTGEPVGSRTISRQLDLGLSAATIRNVMADLEESLYLYQPHTSAGRVPTEQAFRLFVSTMVPTESLSGAETDALRVLDRMHPGEDLLRESGKVLSRLSQSACVVAMPRPQQRRLKELQFVPSSTDPSALLAVLVFADGVAESRIVRPDGVPNDIEVSRMNELLNSVVGGLSLSQVRRHLRRELEKQRMHIDTLTRRAFEMGLLATDGEEATEGTLMLEGQTRLLEKPDFDQVELIRQLVQVLADKERLLSLLDHTLGADAVQVLVGTEVGAVGTGALSMVAAPFSDGSQSLGCIGVLGPTRMDYPKVVSLVQTTANLMTTVHQRASNHEKSSG